MAKRPLRQRCIACLEELDGHPDDYSGAWQVYRELDTYYLCYIDEIPARIKLYPMTGPSYKGFLLGHGTYYG